MNIQLALAQAVILVDNQYHIGSEHVVRALVYPALLIELPKTLASAMAEMTNINRLSRMTKSYAYPAVDAATSALSTWVGENTHGKATASPAVALLHSTFLQEAAQGMEKGAARKFACKQGPSIFTKVCRVL